MNTCADADCARAPERRGFCGMHYRRYLKDGSLTRWTRPVCSVDGCPSLALSRGMCDKHYRRILDNGTLTKRTRANGEAMSIVRYGASAAGPGACVMLTNPGGARPSILLGGVSMAASRASWIIANGDPGEQWVLHSCGRGVQGCVRLGHLYLGDARDNAIDRVTDGVQLMGAVHHNAKLTEEQVKEILNTPRRSRHDPSGTAHLPTLQDLADRYGVSFGTIRSVVERRGWKQVTF